MIFVMTPKQSHSLARFLNRKYADRVADKGHGYSVKQFASDLGIKRSTLIRLMDERNVVEGMDTAVFLALYDEYGAEVIDALRTDAGANK